MGVGFIVGVLGVLILSHAAYATVQYRNLLKRGRVFWTSPERCIGVDSRIDFEHVGWTYCARKVPFYTPRFR